MHHSSTLINDKDEITASNKRLTRTASVSVVMPVRNEEYYLAATLDQLLSQQREELTIEILIVDGRSEDRTREIANNYAARYLEIRVLDNPQQLSSAARNIGIEHSTGEFIVIIDGHCEIPSDRYLLDLVVAFQSSDADCLGRPQPQDVSKATILQKAIAAARSSRLGHHPASFIYSGKEVECPAMSVAVAYRREVFQQVGLFDTSFDACEDCELNHRIDQAGLRCRLVPKLTIKYEPRTSLAGLFRQLARYGRGRVRLWRKHPETFSLMTFIPAVFFAFLLVVAIAMMFTPVLAYVFWPILATYLLCLVAQATILVCQGEKMLACLLVPVVLLTVHLAVGTGVAVEFANRNYSA